jgi:hypothetical protein
MSPSSVDLPQFDVDADVLARSPMGSVTDLSTCVQSDIEENVDKADVVNIVSEVDPTNNVDAKSVESVDGSAVSTEVNIVVTSPRGSEAKVAEDDEEEKTETLASPAEEKVESSEFVNSQGVTFKPTAENVDDTGYVATSRFISLIAVLLINVIHKRYTFFVVF